MKRLTILLNLVCIIYVMLAPASSAAESQPNIIFILSDDVGLGNISCYGGSFKTPNINALAAGGTRFDGRRPGMGRHNAHPEL